MTIQAFNNLNQHAIQQPVKSKKPTDRFETYIKNTADMNDCIAVPRTIFKGYLGVMFGTALASIAGMLKPSKIKTGLNIAAIGLSAFGTWSFARPYVLKGAVPNAKPSTKN